MAYVVGSTVPDMRHTVRDATGNPANATTVTLEIRLPDATTVTPPVTNPPAETGVYRVDYVPVTEGKYDWYLSTTGPASAAHGTFTVWPKFPTHVVSLADVKRHLNKTDTADDDELLRFIGVATHMMERHTGLVIAKRTILEYRHTSYTDELWLDNRPIISVLSITSADGDTTWSVDPAVLSLDSELGRIVLLSGPYWTGDLAITELAGMAVIPDAYTHAGLEIVRRLWDSQRQPGVGPSPFGEAAPTRPTRVDDELLTQLLGPAPPAIA